MYSLELEALCALLVVLCRLMPGKILRELALYVICFTLSLACPP